MNICCPKCKAELEVDAKYVGCKGQCPFCQNEFVIAEKPREILVKTIYKDDHANKKASSTYWQLFKDAPVSVKVATCELIFVMLLSCLFTVVSFIMLFFGKSHSDTLGALLFSIISLTSTLIWLVFTLRHLKGYGWVRVVIISFMALSACCSLLKPSLEGWRDGSSGLVMLSIFNIPFWTKSTSRWISEQKKKRQQC